MNTFKVLLTGERATYTRTKKNVFASLFFLLAGIISYSPAVQMETVNKVFPGKATRQTLIGYGQGNMEQTTPKWYARYNEEMLEKILDSIYTLNDNGLGMNICRYPMPAADAPGHDHMRRLPKSANKPFEYEDGKFNWDGHEDVLWFGKGAVERGAIMWASWYGYPYWLSTSGCAAGSQDGTSSNLQQGKESRFIKHVMDVLEHFRREWAIEFDYVNPINEPEADWWKAGGGQPGAYTTPQQAITLYKELKKELKAKQFNHTEIVGYDAAYTNSTDYLEILLDGGLAEVLDVLACHQYITSEEALRRWADYAEKHDKDLWMSEWGDWTNAGDKSGMQVKQMMNYATKLHEAFDVLEANAWVAWEMGFVFDEADDSLEPRKSYWAIAQYSRHIRPGAIRIACSETNLKCKTTLWIDKNDSTDRKVIFVTVNTDTKPIEMQYDLRQFRPCKIKEVRRTSPEENYVSVTDFNHTDTTLILTSPGESITTIVLE